MTKEYVTIKIELGTRPKLRMISMATGESIIAIVDRLASEELMSVESDLKTSVNSVMSELKGRKK